MSDHFSKDDFSRLSKIVNQVTGNKIEEKHSSMLESRLKSRMIKLGINDIVDYWQHYAANTDSENLALQSLMTTHHTFFFREMIHFEFISKWIDQNIDVLKKRCQSKPFRAWSAACSRGQEVYSLAMHLDDALTRKHGLQFEILGTDIDKESVKYAQNGVYPLKEVLSIPQLYLSRFWKKGKGDVEGFAAAKPELKSRAQFRDLNLLDSTKIKGMGSFDLIMIRNVLIYFSEDKVKSIALSLKDQLLDEALLISGLSEPIRFDGWNLSSLGPSCYTNSREKPKDTSSSKPNTYATAKGNEAAPILVNSGATAAKQFQVLCVDDSVTIQKMMSKIFAGHPDFGQVTIAKDGLDAKEKLKSGTFDLITLDIHMPNMDGLEFLETSYDRRLHPPVLMVSSVNRTDVDLAQKAMKLGAVDYVEKPEFSSMETSTDEIIAKALLVIRSGSKGRDSIPSSIDQEMSKKISIQNPETCLRWVYLKSSSAKKLEDLFAAYRYEATSVATVFVAEDSDFSQVASLLQRKRPARLKFSQEIPTQLNCDHIHIILLSQQEEILEKLKASSLSIQYLDFMDATKAIATWRFKSFQILVDEAATKDAAYSSLNGNGEVAPATSFASFSFEFFAKLRGSKAA